MKAAPNPTQHLEWVARVQKLFIVRSNGHVLWHRKLIAAQQRVVAIRYCEPDPRLEITSPAILCAVSGASKIPCR